MLRSAGFRQRMRSLIPLTFTEQLLCVQVVSNSSYEERKVNFHYTTREVVVIQLLSPV